jgi:hypothetical protein
MALNAVALPANMPIRMNMRPESDHVVEEGSGAK